MHAIKVMVNGLPGQVASVVAGHILNDHRFELIPFSLTGPEIEADSASIGDTVIQLIRPGERDARLAGIRRDFESFISVDYTHPTAVNDNALFYTQHRLPFVMGTTGGDREALTATVTASETAAVIAPNMAKQIVGFQAMMEWTAETFPGLFKGYHLEIKESHQQGKADTSGTAKAMVGYFNRLGLNFSVQDIQQERDPDRQQKLWGVPETYLSGHGWHTYTLVSQDRTVSFEFKHNINGREIYGSGTKDAILFLNDQLARGAKGRVFSMIDVLKAGGA